MFTVPRRDINYFGINVCIIEPGFFKTAVTSLDPLERELHRLWDQLSPEVQASYGDKYLDKCKYTPGHRIVFQWTVALRIDLH